MYKFLPKTDLNKLFIHKIKCNKKVTFNKNIKLDEVRQALSLFFAFVNVLICTFFAANHAYAQNEVNQWYFGFHAGINFATSPPTTLTNGQISTNEGCAAISNDNGQLLFYTDGIKVWNNEHQVMPNATDLAGNYSATQSAIIVPQPQSNEIYYIFTVDDIAHDGGLQYSIVDMTLDNDKGNVLIKNVPLLTPVAEKITSIRHSNKSDIWIIAHEWNSNAFFAYLLTENGLSNTPVISYVGSIHEGDSGGDARGYLKASADGSKLALALQSSAIFEVFDFDANLGTVMNAQKIDNNIFNWSETYGVEFSPDGTKLYGTAANNSLLNIYQFDLTANDIANSGMVIGSTESDIRGALQLAPNGKIYLARYGSHYLGAIDFPNLIDTNCQYIDDGIFLGNDATSAYGLPSFMQSYFNNFHISHQGACLGDSTQLMLYSPVQVDSIVWQINNDFIYNDLNAKYLFQEEADYLVQATVFYDNQTYETSQIITIESYPQININQEQILACENEILLLELNLENVSYEWPDGSTGNTFCVTEAGIYNVTISNTQLCTSITSFNIVTNYEGNTDLILENEMQNVCYGTSSDISNTTLFNAENQSYILHNHPDSDFFMIYAENETATFSVNDSELLNNIETYYISALQSDIEGISPTEQVVYNCLHIQNTIPIRFLEAVNLSIEAYAIGVENCNTLFQVYGEIEGNTNNYVLILENEAINVNDNSFTFNGTYSEEILRNMLAFDENNCLVIDVNVQVYDNDLCFWDVQMPNELQTTCDEINIVADCLHAPRITYILHTNAGNVMDNILSINDLGNFNIEDVVGYENDTLYVSAMVGEDTGGVLPDVNFCNWNNDAAFVSAVATPVIFMAENGENCETTTPISLLYFEGKAEQNSNLLKWATATEINNAFFSLQVSIDGSNFREITKTQGKGNSNTTQYYSFLDKNNLENKLYYRLLQTDFDGTTTISKTVLLNRFSSDKKLTIYPLPAQNEVFIYLEKNVIESQDYHFRLFDNLGNCLQSYTKETDFATRLQLDISHLKSGFYFVEISNETQKWQRKIIKI